MTPNPVSTPQPYVVLHKAEIALACGREAEVLAEELHGLFAGDTRVLSTYRFGIGGHPWRLLASWQTGNDSARWAFQNRVIRDATGDISEGKILLDLKRQVDGGLHDAFYVQSFLRRPLRTRFSLQVDADFADIFEVKQRSLLPRISIARSLDTKGITLEYEREGFRRALHIRFTVDHPLPYFVGSQVVFDLDILPGEAWECSVDITPVIDGKLSKVRGPLPQAREATPDALADPEPSVSGTLVEGPFRQGQRDLHALAIPQDGAPPYIAAGVPWFLTLFGRDPLVTALMAGIDGPWTAEGILTALSRYQAVKRDDWRDAEPGKLPHELRRGERAWQGVIPHTPYFGTHDAPALYCMALWNAWRWTGDNSLLDRHLDTARAALRWCDDLGDRDGDGFLEYATRSRKGYFNQGWKDAEDAIVHADGALAAPPLATVELQGYLFAARLAMAELLDAVGQTAEAARLRSQARALRKQVEDRFWLESERFYALALDGQKQQVASVTSNPGHLLWCGLPSRERAAIVAERLFQEDMHTGWGVRTLSSRNPAYNPLSYQSGSVWPHDTALIAAGLWRYGLRDQASRLLRGLLEAAHAFEGGRLPELFCGLDRAVGVPVPYSDANVPQSWASAVPLLAVQTFLGLVPDAPRNRFFLDPWLPEWLPRLEVKDIPIGGRRIALSVVRQGDRTVIENVEAGGLEAVRGATEAPLWGLPPAWKD